MTSENAISVGRTRGKGFPSLPLDEAVRAIKSAGKYGREHTVGAFAGYLGHHTTNSGPFRTKLASLRDWGLIERPGGDQVHLTELAHQLAHPSSAEQERELLREAFFKAEPFATIYNDSAKEADLSLEFIANRAVTALGIAAPSKQRFADSFVRSVVAAELGRTSSKGSVHLLPPDATPQGAAGTNRDAQTATPAASATAAGSPAAASPAAVPAAGPPSTPPTMYQNWPVRGGSVLFEVRLTKPLPGAAFAALAKVMTTVEAFVEVLSASAPPPAPDLQTQESRDGATK